MKNDVASRTCLSTEPQPNIHGTPGTPWSCTGVQSWYPHTDMGGQPVHFTLLGLVHFQNNNNSISMTFVIYCGNLPLSPGGLSLGFISVWVLFPLKENPALGKQIRFGVLVSFCVFAWCKYFANAPQVHSSHIAVMAWYTCRPLNRLVVGLLWLLCGAWYRLASVRELSCGICGLYPIFRLWLAWIQEMVYW